MLGAVAALSAESAQSAGMSIQCFILNYLFIYFPGTAQLHGHQHALVIPNKLGKRDILMARQ